MREVRRGPEHYSIGTCYELTLDGGLIVIAEVLQATAKVLTLCVLDGNCWLNIGYRSIRRANAVLPPSRETV